ncbi:MAG: peptidoglycan D,D-transpeptidase FtsI family protein [Eubacterium sp.]
MRKKLAVLFIGIVIALFALCIRLIWINVVDGDSYTIRVLNQQQYSSTTIPFKRGDILDRNGNVLATSAKVYNVILDPAVILSDDKYLEPTVSLLVQYFSDLNYDDVVAKIQERKDSSYYVILEALEYDSIEEFQKAVNSTRNVEGIWFETEYERKYPYSTLASSVIGFALDGNTADWGIEGYYNDFLNGTDGRKYGYVDQDNNMESVIKEAEDGDTVISTIDVYVQSIVEKKIASYMKKINAERIAVIIADPNNGEILAMADDHTYDLNSPRDLTGYYTKNQIKNMSTEEYLQALNEMWRNYCISDTFEPGSTMKPFTVAAALEEGKVTENSSFECDGYQVVGGWTIKCHKTSGHGTISLKEAIAYSCNDALMNIGLKMGAKLFSNYQDRFGFGSKTGIDLPGEASGILYDDTMGDSTLATNSFGQNFTVNMIQMVAGFSSLVNGGYYYEPHIAKQIVNTDGGVTESYSKTLVKQTVTEETSEFIREALRLVVTEGTGSKAGIEGYTVGGKTGTAEKTPRGNGEYVLSFIGCVPCEAPQVVCYVVVDTPEENPSDSSYASSFFASIMEDVLPYLNIYATESGEDKEEIGKGEDTNPSTNESYDGNGGIVDGNDRGITDDSGNYGESSNTNNENTTN